MRADLSEPLPAVIDGPYDPPHCAARGGARGAGFFPDGYSLWSVVGELAPDTTLEWGSQHGDEALYVLTGALDVRGTRVEPEAAVIVEAGVVAEIRVIDRARVVHFGPHSPESPSGGLYGSAEDAGRRGVHIVPLDEAERTLLWKGRKSAFGAVARIAPNYYLHDTVVPRTRLVAVLRQVYEIAAHHDLLVLNVFHAGDGNLHPLLVFDAREPGVIERVHAAGAEIVAVSLAAGGVLSGEHGIGLEKRAFMGQMFSVDDLDAQARVRDCFDPDGTCNPGKVLPAGSRCGDIQRLPEGAWI